MPNGLEGTAGTQPATTDPPFAEPVPSNPGPRLQPPLEPGDLGALGQYRVVEVLGKGGMGVVYLGIDTQIRRKVALKTMLPKFASSRVARDRFMKEARAAGAIHHDNVVVIYQVGEAGGTPFIAMEHLEGESLEVHLRKHPSPPLPQVVKILREVAAGLAAAHLNGVIHRDVKPDNIWLEAPSGRVKLLDFGLARCPEINGGQSGTVGLIGTPAYMSPEQARGTGVDHRSDLFSLGSVAYELVVGRPPFTGANMFDVLAGVMSRNPIPPRQVKPYVPATLDTLILRLLAKESDNRPQTAAEVEAELARVLAHLNPASGGEPAVVYVTVPVNVVPEAAVRPDQPAVDAGRFVVTPAPKASSSTVPPAAVTPAPENPVSLSPPADPAPKVGGGSTWSGLASAAAEHPPWESPKAPAPKPFAKWKLYSAAAVGGIAVVGLAAAVVVTIFGGNPSPSMQATTPTTSQSPPTRLSPRGPKFPLLDQAFIEKVKGLTHAEQVKSVTEELRRRNPKFTQSLEPGPSDPKLTRAALCTDNVADITPLRALPNLTQLRLYGSRSGPGILVDLSPLTGLPLTHLTVNNSPVTDLSPIAGLPLELLDMKDTNVETLTPLRGMKSLRTLNLSGCRWATNLEALRGLPLKSLDVTNTLVDNFTPVAECPLEVVKCGPKAVDLGAITNCPLSEVVADPPPEFASPLRTTNVKTVNRMAAASYWKRADLRKEAGPVTPFAVWNTTGRPAMALAWVPATDLLAVATPDAVTGRTVGIGLTPWKSTRLEESTSDGRWTAVSGDRLAVAFRGRIRFFDPKTGSEKGEGIDPGRNTDAYAASRDGRFVAAAHPVGDAPRFTVFPTDGMGEPVEFKDVPRFARAIALSRDGTLAAAGGWHGFKVWDIASNKEILATWPDEMVNAVQFAAVGRRVLMLTAPGDLLVFDPDRKDKPKEPIYRLSGHGLAAACFTPDAAGLVVAWSDGWMGYYPLDKTGPAIEFATSSEPIRSMSFSPDGKTLVTGHEQNVRLWDWAAIRTPSATKLVDPPPGFEKLFNGTDLTGWTNRDWEPKDSWFVHNGHLVGSSTQHDKSAWLETEKEYGDFELRLEYRWLSLGGDAGIALRMKKSAGWPAHDSLELNLADDTNAEDVHGRPPHDWERTGALTGFAKPTEKSPKRIGEWNTVKIIARGRLLLMEQNGKIIQAVDLAKLDAAVKDKDKEHARGLKQTKGVIALQALRGRIEYRNVVVKEIPPDPPKK